MATVHDITQNADAFRAAYPNWPGAEPERAPAAVQIGGRLYGLDDAMSASLVLAEAEAGRPETARRLAVMGHIDGLSDTELDALCKVFGVQVYPIETATG